MGRRPCACEAAVNPSSTQPTRSILHVRTGPSRQVQGMAARLADRSLAVDVCDDVYRALARLGRATGDSLAVVFICMDDLLPMELEFFKFAKRLNGELRVYVYGSNGPRDRLTTAIELGADGVVTDALLDKLSGGADRSPSVEASGATGAEASPVREATSDITAPPDVAQAAPTAMPEPEAAPKMHPEAHERPPSSLRMDDESTASSEPRTQHEAHPDPADIAYEEPTADAGAHEEVDEGEEESTRPVRVPWLRYDQAPPRDPPDATPRPNQRRPAPPAPPDRNRPLLTEEEVRALMGEDFPESDETRRNRDDDERADGRKNSEHD